jgi:hypothetical protein
MTIIYIGALVYGFVWQHFPSIFCLYRHDIFAMWETKRVRITSFWSADPFLCGRLPPRSLGPPKILGTRTFNFAFTRVPCPRKWVRVSACRAQNDCRVNGALGTKTDLDRARTRTSKTTWKWRVVPMYGYATSFWRHFHVVFDVRVLDLNSVYYYAFHWYVHSAFFSLPNGVRRSTFDTGLVTKFGAFSSFHQFIQDDKTLTIYINFGKFKLEKAPNFVTRPASNVDRRTSTVMYPYVGKYLVLQGYSGSVYTILFR